MATTGDGDGEDLVRDVGRRIAEVRAAKGLTQERFAETLGIELRNVQRLEGGRANITLSTLSRVARALGVRPSELLETPASRVTKRGRPRRLSIGEAPAAPQGDAEAPLDEGDRTEVEVRPHSQEATPHSRDGAADAGDEAVRSEEDVSAESTQR